MHNFSDAIILVDDDMEDAYLIARAIESHGWKGEFQHFTSGADFLSYFHNSIKDNRQWLYNTCILLLVDIRMPGDDGFSVLKSIRTDAKMTSIPVCMLTTSRHSIDVRRAFTLGANCYLCKSNSFAETKEQIARTLDFWFKQSVLLPPREVA